MHYRPIGLIKVNTMSKAYMIFMIVLKDFLIIHRNNEYINKYIYLSINNYKYS